MLSALSSDSQNYSFYRYECPVWICRCMRKSVGRDRMEQIYNLRCGERQPTNWPPKVFSTNILKPFVAEEPIRPQWEDEGEGRDIEIVLAYGLQEAAEVGRKNIRVAEDWAVLPT